jgi:DNA invertase Pin-like site-specific DNA recombinase
MFGAPEEFERSLIRERTQAGLAAARRAGRTGGRPPKLTDARANREYARRLTRPLYPKDRTLQEGFSLAAGGGSAPIPAVRGIAIESREATQLRHWPREFGASAT